MALSRSQLIVSSAFLVVAMGTVGALFYRATTVDLEARQRENQRRADAAQPLRKTTVLADRVVLIKDEAVNLDRARMVYRGLADGLICIDVILLDTPPIIPVADTMSLQDQVDGFILIFRIGFTPYVMLRQALEEMEKTKILGVVLNGVEMQKYKYYHRYYGDYYQKKPR